MTKHLFELDVKYEDGFPIGLNPNGNKNFDLNPEQREKLDKWKPDCKPISGLVRNNIGNSCVGLSRLFRQIY